ncbi:MAG: 16S rRNA (adenine(1518)-N(6)/adenine(1519)-N(6))-dimethyltransferase RsmA [Candidatus Omnitrophica bacterium]|jgi:16S rRNA (adenine1518-N6/adenine1519-N6)-dimethyltransferase|nr:16S rRNA (adenine(1518)-N(6)/adenine(1519)-N(6))-dimethyltransferase RsmA [Candidatus Omnitrophota bacterium]
MQIKPKKSLGQNFLTDKNIQQKIISACSFDRQDTVLEIGSGRGELTQLIAPTAGKVFALEIDSRIISVLKDNCAGFNNVELVHADVMKFDFVAFFKKQKSKIKVFGNIPYYITTPIIELFLQYRSKISEVFLTVQKEFAERLTAVPGSKRYGSLSCFLQYYTKPEILFIIKKNSFTPRPKVDSAFLRLEVLKIPSVKAEDEERLFKVIRTSFNQRRKTLRNSLEGIIERKKLDIFFTKFNLSPNIRPEDLPLNYFAALSAA